MLTVIVTSQTSSNTHAQVAAVTIPTPNGHITILPHHDRLITVISKGTIQITQQNNKLITYQTIGGIAQINKNTVKILLD